MPGKMLAGTWHPIDMHRSNDHLTQNLNHIYISTETTIGNDFANTIINIQYGHQGCINMAVAQFSHHRSNCLAQLYYCIFWINSVAHSPLAHTREQGKISAKALHASTFLVSHNK